MRKDGYMSTELLCEELEISRQTVWRWIKDGMPYKAFGIRRNMFKLDEVMNWLEEQRK